MNFKQEPTKHLHISGTTIGRRNDLLVFQPSDTKLIELKQFCEYDLLPFRKLIQESADVFLQNQRTLDSPMSAAEALNYSRSQRSILRSVLTTLKGQLADDGRTEPLEQLLSSLTVCESTFTICEIVFIQQPHGGELLTSLLSWLRNHLDDVNTNLDEILTPRDDDPMDNPLYWPCVINCTLQGRIDDALTLLGSTEVESYGLKSLKEIMRAMPTYGKSGSALVDFKLKWINWHQELKEMIRCSRFSNDENLTVLSKILVGDENTLHEATERFCLPWYSYLIAYQLFRKPFCTISDVQDQVQPSVDRYGGDVEDDADILQKLVQHALNKDIMSLLKAASENMPNWWLIAHICDIFYQAGSLRETNSIGISIREGLVLEYASSLMENESLWTVGAKYLKTCPTHGRQFLQEYLGRISINSSTKALKIINICEELGFTGQVTSISRTMARRCLAENRLGSALTWCRHTKDSYLATQIAQRFLEQFQYQSLTDSHSDILDALGSTTVLSHNLLFLSKWREFHKLYQEGLEIQACTLITELLTSRIAPQKYWHLLLRDTLPLLEARKVRFTSDQIYDLMNCLVELQQSHSTLLREDVMDTDRLEALQLALNRALARVIISDKHSLGGISGCVPVNS